MKIFIPTKGRIKQLTMEALPIELRKRYDATLVVQTEEDYNRLRSYYPTVWADAEGIGATRQWILDNSTDDKVVMLDDDLCSWSRRNHFTGQYVKAGPHDIVEGFELLDELLSDHAHAAIGHRQFANTKPLVEYGTRAMRALGYRRDVLARENIRFTLPLMEDFEVTLKLFRAGYPNAVFYGLIQDQLGSDQPGGCKYWRTLERHNAAAEALAEMFPRFVKLKDVEGWAIGTRKDVSIQWKKALNDE